MINWTELDKQMIKVGLEQREGQRAMINAVYQALTKHDILCLEAPTGTGKTLAYIVGALLGKQAGQHLVISTATITLQQQLIDKDLPLVSRILPQHFKWALAKGRRRYLCLARFYQQDAGQAALFVDVDQESLQYLKQMMQSQTWLGDRDQLERTVPAKVWQSVSTDTAGCQGKRCEFYEDCYFYRARKRMYSADVVVANHNLLLADLSLGGGVLLPDIQETVFIIDECHHLVSKAIDHFAHTSYLLRNRESFNQLSKLVGHASADKMIANSEQQRVKQLITMLMEEIKQQKSFLDMNQTQFIDGRWQIEEDVVEQFQHAPLLVEYSRDLVIHCQRLSAELTTIYEGCVKSNPGRAEAIQKFLLTFEFLIARLSYFQQTWQWFCQPRAEKEAPIARWFEKISQSIEGETVDDYVCHTSPINVSQMLAEHLWNRSCNGVVLCSATVRSLGSFNDFLRKSGLKQRENAVCSTMSSSFDFQKSLLFVPTMSYEPSGQASLQHCFEASQLLPELILPRYGTLVLFASQKAMHETYQAMPLELQQDILMQGQHNKTKLIQRHKHCIQCGQRSILFGLASLAEGLDLPADYCHHVIIHKIPFAVPSDPVERARSRWLAQNHLNAFMLHMLPEASVKLTQSVGRLVRQPTDFGVVSILDKRLYSKSYGKQLLAGLPDFVLCINQSVAVMKSHDLIASLYKAVETCPI